MHDVRIGHPLLGIARNEGDQLEKSDLPLDLIRSPEVSVEQGYTEMDGRFE